MLKLEGIKREKGIAVDNSKELKAIVYGSYMENNILVNLKHNDFIKIYEEVGTSQIISLSVDGEDYEVMIKEFQLDPVSDRFIHVDFYAITRGEEMEVVVPFEFEGVAPAIEKGAIINEVITEIKVKTLPRNIPSEIKINLSVLENEGDAIRLTDIKLPEGVSFVTEHLDEVIVSASAIKEEKEDFVEESETTEESNEGAEEEKA